MRQIPLKPAMALHTSRRNIVFLPRYLQNVSSKLRIYNDSFSRRKSFIITIIKSANNIALIYAATFGHLELKKLCLTYFKIGLTYFKIGLTYFKISQTYFCMPFQAYQLSSLLDLFAILSVYKEFLSYVNLCIGRKIVHLVKIFQAYAIFLCYCII